MATLRRWTEAVEGFDRIDEESGIIRGVRILGLESKNGRDYLREAVTAAIQLYEGAKVYLDHERDESPDRRNVERWGKLQSVTQVADGGLIGDLAYLKSHPMTESILEAIKRFGDFGLSQDASGTMSKKDGKPVVDEIREVHSVDLVQGPATTQSLFESESRPMKVKLLKALRENSEIPHAEDILSRLMEMEIPGQDMEEMEMEVDQEVMEMDDGTYAIDSAFRAAMIAILDAEDLSTDERMDKLRKLLDVKTEVVDGEQVTEQEGDEEEEVQESELKELKNELKQLREEKARLKAREDSRKLLEQMSRDVTTERVDILSELSESKRSVLIRTWEKAGETRPTTQKPARSPSRVHESTGDLPSSAEEFRKQLSA